MKRLINLMLLAIIAFACKLPTAEKNINNEPVSSKNAGPDLQRMAAEFPAPSLDRVINAIGQDELMTVIEDGESGNWKRIQPDPGANDIIIKSKLGNQGTSNSIRFKLYGRTPTYAMIAVQQTNGQLTDVELWEYRYTVNETFPEKWNQYLLPEYKLENFFDDRVILPPGFQAQSATPYLSYEFTPTTISITFNKWSYMRNVLADSLAAEGPLDPTLVKYRYLIKWNGTGFDEDKLKEAGYNDILTFNSRIIERVKGGQGPNDRECERGVSVSSSSTRSSEGGHTFKASNVIDGDNATVWCEGIADDGVGEFLEFTITSDYKIGDQWTIVNGASRNKDVWQANNRVKKMKVFVDDTVAGYVMLSNVAVYQSFNIAPEWLKHSQEFKKGTRIRFVIEEVYRGARFNDTMISALVPLGDCR